MTKTLVKTLFIASALAALVACSSGGSKTIDKPTSGKGDAAEKLCQQAGEPADCDICELQGWYGDGACDDFCTDPDPDCASDRDPNPACDSRLDAWMYGCIELNLSDGETLIDAIDFCVSGVEDGEPLEIEGICEMDDGDCFLDLADNAPDCAAAIGDELEGPEPNPACDERLYDWMFTCIEHNMSVGETLEDAVDFCVNGVWDGEPLEIEGICEMDDGDCFLDLADNAEACAAAIADDLQ